MPGYDGTGPAGAGPFTGGGRGYCAVDLEHIYDRRPVLFRPAGTGRLSLPGFAGRSGQIVRGARVSRWAAGGPGRRCGFGRGRRGAPGPRGRGAAFYR